MLSCLASEVRDTSQQPPARTSEANASLWFQCGFEFEVPTRVCRDVKELQNHRTSLFGTNQADLTASCVERTSSLIESATYTTARWVSSLPITVSSTKGV